MLTFCHIFRGCVLHSQGDQTLQRSLAPAVNIAKYHIKMISHNLAIRENAAKKTSWCCDVVCPLLLSNAYRRSKFDCSISIYKHRQTAACDPTTLLPSVLCSFCFCMHFLAKYFVGKGTEIEGVFFSCRRFLPYPILLLLVIVIKACPALHNYHLGRIDKTGQD